MNRYECATVILLALNFIAFNVYLILQWRQVGLMRKTAETAQRQFEAMDRAWIKVHVDSPGLRFFDDPNVPLESHRVELSTRLTFTNVGHTVARNVRWIVELIPSKHGKEVTAELEHQSKMIASEPSRSKTPGTMLFPSESVIVEMVSNTGRRELESAIREDPEFSKLNRFVADVIGTVAYELPSSDKPGITQFVYLLRQSAPGGDYLLEVGKDYPPPTLMLVDFGASRAN